MAAGISRETSQSDPAPKNRRRRRRANCPDRFDAGVAEIRGETFENQRRVWRSDQFETKAERNQVAEVSELRQSRRHQRMNGSKQCGPSGDERTSGEAPTRFAQRASPFPSPPPSPLGSPLPSDG